MEYGNGDIGRGKIARTAGILYLAYIVATIICTFVQRRPVVSGDAGATARNIVASTWVFRTGFTIEVVSALLFLLTAWSLYVLMRPVGKDLALLFLILNACGVAVECFSTVIRFAALPLVGGTGYLKALQTEQLQALAMFFLNWAGTGSVVSILFYGTWLLPLGYLVIKSNFLPRALGVLLILDGASLLICFSQLCLFPGYERLTYALYPVMFVAECGLGLWLVIKGVRYSTESTAPTV